MLVEVTRSYKGLRGVTGGYKESQRISGILTGIRRLLGLQGVTRVYKGHLGLQPDTWGNRELQEVI